ncbi:MAG: NAD(P)H-dependent oxidoreductase, partial [Clostridia bacterium]|nr:NAD(P)H-dependent oxidoreductase [Clostridia bacterium]
MKYLVINGSPHKGNTWKITMEAKQQIMNEDPASVFEEVHLAQLNLPFCTGCSNCFRKGGEYCPHKEIMNMMIEKMETADGILIASTTFNCRETAILKNFFDHMCYMLHRPRFFTKKALVITSVGGVGGGQTVKSVVATLRGIGVNKCYGLCIRSISWNAYQIHTKDEMKIKKAAKKFADDVKSSKLHKPNTLILIPYNLFRGMSVYYQKGTEYETLDGTYYMDPDRKKTVYDKQIPVSFFQKIMGTMFYQLGKTL